MVFTDKQIEAIKAAALPIKYGSITIQIGPNSYLDLDVHNKIRVEDELVEHNDRKKRLKKPLVKKTLDSG